MRTFRVSEEPGRTRFKRVPDFKAILLIAIVEAVLFFAYRVIMPSALRTGLLVVFSVAAAGVLWPRIIGEDVVLSGRTFRYRRGLWPLILSTELEWVDVDMPRILNAGVRGWRGPIAFNDARTGRQFRIGAGLRPAECRRMLDAAESFKRISPGVHIHQHSP